MILGDSKSLVVLLLGSKFLLREEFLTLWVLDSC